MKKNWEIAGLSIEPDTKIQKYIQIEDSVEYMPVTFINGKEEGKTILVTAGIHGGEYEGIHAAIELARDISPEDIKGQLIVCLLYTSDAADE